MEDSRDHTAELRFGTAGIINFLRAYKMTWKAILSEFLDNSFGAGASNILFRKNGLVFRVIDDGSGCGDLVAMESPAQSIRLVGDRAGKYGIGGVMSQIVLTNAGLVEVKSATTEVNSLIKIDWSAIIESDRPTVQYHHVTPTVGSSRTGTTITLSPCRKFGDIDVLVRDLGYLYSGQLKENKTITLDVEDQVYRVTPYKHPKFTQEIKLDFNLNGHRITGFCGVVDPKESNPYSGWSIHWGYRVVDRFSEPADGKPSNRIYSEVYLPTTWQDISVTKDSFLQDCEPLWDALAELCRPIVDAAEAQSQEFQISSATRAAESLLTEAVRGSQHIKGARPGSGGGTGTVEPTGTGSPHRNFSTSQPGDKSAIDASGHVKLPRKVTITWDDTLEGSYEVTIGGRRVRTMNLALNPSYPKLRGFRDEPDRLAVLCCSFIASAAVSGNRDIQAMFPTIQENYHADVFSYLLSNIGLNAGAEEAA